MLTYDKDSPSWGNDLRLNIVQAIKETIQSPETAIPTAFMHIKPARVESDELIVRLRRIEERLTEIAGGGQVGRQAVESSLQHKMHSLPEAEEQAERLLRRMSQPDAIERLMTNGFGRAMAEAAVAVAARRLDASA
jgi:hypothetical protein